MIDRSDPDLHCGDCLEVLPRLVADRGAGFDHIITDPPYEDVHHAHHARGTIARTDGRGAPRPVPYAGVESIREATAQAMVAGSAGWVLVFCLAEGVRPWHDALTGAGARWHGTMAWIKPDAAPQFAGIGPARGFECIAVAWAGSGRRRWNGGGTRGVLTCNTAKGGLPGSKPVPVMAALVDQFSQPGETLCDPFMGSGTTGMAAVQAGRGFTGVEINPETFGMAQGRISTAVQSPYLPLRPRARQTELSLS